MQLGFSSPILIVESNLDQNFFKSLIDDIYNIRKSDSGYKISNLDGWHSKSDLFVRKEDSFKKVCQILGSSIGAVMKTFQADFNDEKIDARFTGWINVNPKGGSNVLHSHPGFHWSGVLYIKQPENVDGLSGMIEFVNPNQEGRELAKILPKVGFDGITRIRPKVGQIVVFPSYMLHSVYPNKSEEDRITIAFNAGLNLKN